MIPKYKYKYQDQRHAGTTIAYCKFEIQARIRWFLDFNGDWVFREGVIQSFEVFTPAFRHVNYEKPVMTEPKIGEPSMGRY